MKELNFRLKRSLHLPGPRGEAMFFHEKVPRENQLVTATYQPDKQQLDVTIFESKMVSELKRGNPEPNVLDRLVKALTDLTESRSVEYSTASDDAYSDDPGACIHCGTVSYKECSPKCELRKAKELLNEIKETNEHNRSNQEVVEP